MADRKVLHSISQIVTARIAAAAIAVAICLGAPAAASAQDPTPIPNTVPALVSRTSTSVTVGWEPQPDWDYQLQWRAAGASWSTDNFVATAGGSYLVGNLLPDSSYDFRIRWKKSNADDYAAWAADTPVTTIETLQATDFSPEVLRLEGIPSVVTSGSPVGFVWPTGETLVVVGYEISRPDYTPYPSADRIAEWRVNPPSLGLAHTNPPFRMSPREIVGTDALGYGRGIMAGYCRCFPENMSSAEVDNEADRVWQVTRTLNPYTVPGALAGQPSSFRPTFFRTAADTVAASRYLAAALAHVEGFHGVSLVTEDFATDIGVEYLEAQVPGIRTLLPSLFPGTRESVSTERVKSGERIELDSITGEDDGPVGMGISGFRSVFDIGHRGVTSLVVVILAVVAGVFAAVQTQRGVAAVMAAGAVLSMGGAIGWMDGWVSGFLFVLATAICGWMIFGRKGA